MKAIVTAAVILLCIGSAALPAPAAEQQEKKVRKIVTIEKHAGGAWLGVALQDVTDEIAKDKHLSVKGGALVTEVVDDSPADSAGVRENDVILEVAGTAVGSANDVIKRVGELKTGETASVVVMRDGAKKSIPVKLGERPERVSRMEMRMPSMPRTPYMPRMGAMPPMAAMGMHAGIEGMKLIELTDQLGKYFDAPDNKALLVTNVKKNSNARKAGIEAGDVIIRVGKTDIEDMGDLHSA